MKRQNGFTLIELVVVIVILGILAVTAAPRFLNLQDDAREASLEGLRGAVAGAMGISYGRAAISGIETQAVSSANLTATTIDGVVYSYGYPTAATGGIIAAVDLSSDFVVLDSDNDDAADHTNATIDIGLSGYTSQCVRYTAATSSNAAVAAVISGAAGSACGMQ
ncbi:MSHA biogenesis protein MshA [Vibrio anguillarum]|uniref:type II secretion system protein n=1 Tax=Vibrio anguillarum TaxID=55601 RepID=UPI000B7BE9B4|nr:type II secretion system protein [Vibrio anguillarum]ASO28283.1 MSHA biogenesis protein MshA [Vibrio anguillarum]